MAITNTIASTVRSADSGIELDAPWNGGTPAGFHSKKGDRERERIGLFVRARQLGSVFCNNVEQQWVAPSTQVDLLGTPHSLYISQLQQSTLNQPRERCVRVVSAILMCHVKTGLKYHVSK